MASKNFIPLKVIKSVSTPCKHNNDVIHQNNIVY